MAIGQIGTSPTITPGGYYGRYDLGTYANPAYDVSSQFLPRSFHDLLKWTRFIIVKSPTSAEVLRKLATYPITEVTVSSPKKQLREKYEEIFESVKLIEKMSDGGFDYHAYGNSFTSIYFPIDRMLECPKCKTSYNSRKALDGKYAIWKKFQFSGECPGCSQKVIYKRIDTKSKDVNRINIIKWKPDNISINDNPITGDTEYFYNIPGDVKRKILIGDPHFLTTVPWEFVEAVRTQKEFKFAPGAIHHMKSLTMGDFIEGFGVPPLLSHYSTVFYMQCLKKANEAIALEHMNPMRVLYPQQSSSAGDPVSMMSMNNFTTNVKSSLQRFKQDPNHVLLSPVPIGTAYVGGQGKSLLVTQELQFAEEQLLMAMGVSRELLSGTTNWTSSTVGLRLLENNMNQYNRKIKRYLTWIVDQIANYLGLEEADVSLVPYQLTDNDALKNMYLQLHQASLISGKTLLETCDIDPEKESEKIVQEQIDKAEESVRMKYKMEQAVYMAHKDEVSDGEDESGYNDYRQDVMTKAQAILQEPDEQKRMEMVMALQAEDEAKYDHVMTIIQQYMGGADEVEEDPQAGMQKAASVTPKPKPTRRRSRTVQQRIFEESRNGSV